MSTVVSITMSKEFLALMDPKETERRMVRFNEAMGNLLLGRQDKLLTGDTGVARIDPAPLQRSFGKWYKGNKRVAKFPKYAGEEVETTIKRGKNKGQTKKKWVSKYEQEKKALNLDKFLVYSGALYSDAVTDAKIKTSSRGVSITAKKGQSKDYQLVHQLGSATVPKRPPYIIDAVDRKSMILPLTTVLLSLFRGSLATVKLR